MAQTRMTQRLCVRSAAAAPARPGDPTVVLRVLSLMRSPSSPGCAGPCTSRRSASRGDRVLRLAPAAALLEPFLLRRHGVLRVLGGLHAGLEDPEPREHRAGEQRDA